jgi:hypothetical protein
MVHSSRLNLSIIPIICHYQFLPILSLLLWRNGTKICASVLTHTAAFGFFLRLKIAPAWHSSEVPPCMERQTVTIDTASQNKSVSGLGNSWVWNKCKAIQLQAWSGPEGSRRLRLPDFKTIGTWMWWGYQPYTPATFTPRKYSWYSFLLKAESTPEPQCGRKDYINKKFQLHHRESNP